MTAWAMRCATREGRPYWLVWSSGARHGLLRCVLATWDADAARGALAGLAADGYDVDEWEAA